MFRQFKEQIYLQNSPPPPASLDFFRSFKDAKWTTRLVVNGSRTEYPANEPLDEIKKHNNAIVRVVGNPIFGLNFGVSEQTQSQIRLLAEHGKALFESLVPEPSRRDFIDLILNGAVRSIGPASHRRNLLLTFEQACRIWWQFIYIADLPEDKTVPVDLSGFLGSKALFVADCLVNEAGDGFSEADRLASIGIPAAENPIVRHVWDNKLIPDSFPVDKLWHDSLSAIQRLEVSPPLGPNTDPKVRIPMADQLMNFVTSPSDTLHFDCHGLADDEMTPWIIHLGVIKDYTAKHVEVTAWQFGSVHLPIGILNVCNSARGQLGDTSLSVAEHFIFNGMAAVVAPMAKAPLVLLMDMSKALYEALLRDEPLLSAFSVAQMQIFNSGNPASLSLVLHAEKGEGADDITLRFDGRRRD